MRGGIQRLADFYTLADVRLEDASTGVRQSWVPCFPQGKFNHPEYGELDFSPASLQLYLDHFYDRVRKIDIAVDVDHKNEEAVGWIRDMQYRPGVGVFALVDWNQLGSELVADRRYRYISPQFGEYQDEETGKVYPNTLTCLTLTNFPFLKKMPAIALSEIASGIRAGGRRQEKALTDPAGRLIVGQGLVDRAQRICHERGWDWDRDFEKRTRALLEASR